MTTAYEAMQDIDKTEKAKYMDAEEQRLDRLLKRGMIDNQQKQAILRKARERLDI